MFGVAGVVVGADGFVCAVVDCDLSGDGPDERFDTDIKPGGELAVGDTPRVSPGFKGA